VEQTGHSLQAVTIKACLVDSATAEPPPRESVLWLTPTIELSPVPHDNQAKIKLFVDESVYPVGSYYMWALPFDSPTRVPVKASDDRVVLW
jgi:hypothetical protein